MNQTKDVGTESNDADDSTSKVKKQTKLKTEENRPTSKSRAGRKKETIAVDYPETSLEKLEKTKEEKAEKPKARTKIRKHKPTKQES